MGRYTYNTLQERGWFRILVLQPSQSEDNDDIIRGSLLHRSIDDLEREGFEALSYCWGTDEAATPIEIDGTEFLVRPPLHAALLRLRQKLSKPRAIWIDAICINQDDVSERSNQVAQMRDVYSKASRVVVWLGEGDRFLRFGMHVVERWARAARKIEDKWTQILQLNPSRKLEWFTEWNELYDTFEANKFSYPLRARCVMVVFMLDWWMRMWTLQELVLAREAVVHLGDVTVAWRDFETIATLSTVRAVFSRSDSMDSGRAMQPKPKGWSSFMTAMQLCRLIGRRRQGIPISLSLMMDLTSFRRSTDSRDKVFAVLGLIDTPIFSSPDYSKSWQEVYRVAMKDVLLESKDLRAYCDMPVSDPQKGEGLPSWVPNFERMFDELNAKPRTRGLGLGVAEAPNDAVRPGNKSPLYFAGLASNDTDLSNVMEFEDDDKILKLKGIRFDSASQVGDMAPFKRSIKNTVLGWRSLVPGLEEPYTREQSQTRNEAFWCTVCLDCKVHSFHSGMAGTGKSHPRDHKKRLDKEEESIPPRTPLEQERLLEALDRQAQHEVSELPGRVFFITNKGCTGLGPPEMKIGDVVAVFLGAQTPFVIRKTCSGRYWLIGQCYLHGIMNGEVIRVPLQTGQRLEEIRIE